jgi:hypothetical protein
MNKPINFKLWNNAAGWLVFVISLIVYILTLEPTASFWDCGEFLSCACKLEVSHPPGAPLFMLLQRMAAILYPSNPTIMINGMSALASAFTILFLFWTITWFGRKMSGIGWEKSNTLKVSIIAAGFIGSLTYAFTDSFWFSAVEAEVYASSSMLTALVFWCILKWEENVGKSAYSERWLLFITYLFGLSVGVHLLNLLVIPAIVFVYFFKKFPVNKINVLKALGISLFLLFVFLVVILQGIPKLLSALELITVNSWGLPYNTGFYAGLAIVFLLPIGAYVYFSKKEKGIAARAFLYFWLVLVGISSYAVIVIRSYDNPPIDMTNPEDPFALENYLNREQYGQRPLFYGQSFASPAVGSKERNSYQRFDGKYVKYPLNPEVEYDSNSLTLFPRMCSDQSGHPEAYHFWIGDFHGKTIQTQSGSTVLPSFGDNVRFFLRYQLGYMYLRYFMWNFAGKQNDIQGHGTAVYGNWISGFNWLDSARLGNQEKVPTWLKNNPGRNRYFMIPLILGLLGMFYQYLKDRKNFWVAMCFFVLTGMALTVYLNEVPVTPRERDYVCVGSFYVFAIWVGLGVIALFQWFSRKVNGTVSLVASSVVGLASPWLLLQQNYDDHDRSGRYVVLEYARNYLESCAPNAILFTNADNDTYPLWYAQEVEGIRRDIRLVLTPYLSAYWYVDQMRRPIYNQKGLKMALTSDKFIGGKRSYFPVYQQIDSAVDMNSVLNFVGSDEDRAKVGLQNGERVNYIPVKKALLPFPISKYSSNNKQKVSDSIMVRFNDYLRMDEAVLLDIIASNDWERPVYFTSEQVPVGFGLEKFLQLDGFAFRLTPYENTVQSRDDIGFINTDALYDQYMNKFSFQSLANPKVYLDNTHVLTVQSVGIRSKFYRLAEKLFQEGKAAKAEAVLDKVVAMLPAQKVPYDYTVAKMTGLYYLMHRTEKGKDLFVKTKNYSRENIDYYIQLKLKGESVNEFDVNMNLYMVQLLAEIAHVQKLDAFSAELQDLWNRATPVLMQGR